MRPIVIAAVPPPRKALDREEAAAVAQTLWRKAAEVNRHAQANPRIAQLAFGVENGLGSIGEAIAATLERGEEDSKLLPLLQRAEDALSAASDILARNDTRDLDQIARKSPAETVRPQQPVEAL
jgi:hypothetical protein